jgi:hypothetical protein
VGISVALSAYQKKLPYLLQSDEEPRGVRNSSACFGKQIVLRLGAGFCAEITGLRSTELTADRAAGSSASFCNFFFQIKKKLNVLPLQRVDFHKNF